MTQAVASKFNELVFEQGLEPSDADKGTIDLLQIIQELKKRVGFEEELVFCRNPTRPDSKCCGISRPIVKPLDGPKREERIIRVCLKDDVHGSIAIFCRGRRPYAAGSLAFIQVRILLLWMRNSGSISCTSTESASGVVANTPSRCFEAAAKTVSATSLRVSGGRPLATRMVTLTNAVRRIVVGDAEMRARSPRACAGRRARRRACAAWPNAASRAAHRSGSSSRDWRNTRR